ncbi:hypothetical protein IKG13_01035 [Candidatus Saccharibacteria bacterium]|nr:hypothetical protein [Candidatus Saccharibacteria bacterium]MBR3378238.1 hypothetical protein [Candidatus Saccharibacteria bacterium]
MNKVDFVKKLDSLGLDKKRYRIIAGGSLLLYGLKEETEDIDIKIRPDYFDELNGRFNFRKSPKEEYLYEISDDVEVAVLDYDDKDTVIVDGYPIESLELLLDWMIDRNRPKDQEKIKILKAYLGK